LRSGERTPSYEGTRTPSPTAPPLTLTKIVCADVEVAAAARTSEVESFISPVDVASFGALGFSLMLKLECRRRSLYTNSKPQYPIFRVKPRLYRYIACPMMSHTYCRMSTSSRSAPQTSGAILPCQPTTLRATTAHFSTTCYQAALYQPDPGRRRPYCCSCNAIILSHV
jgi:hypothetical protein